MVPIRRMVVGIALCVLAVACGATDGVVVESVAVNPDDAFVIEQRRDAGASYGDALHDRYAQTVGHQLFTDAQQLPGFVSGAYAQPQAGEPFQLSFSGPVPTELDPGAYDLASFGLTITSGGAGFDHAALAAAFDAAREVGMPPVSGSGDETAGSGRIEVIDDPPDELAAWEQAVDDPPRWCLVRAPRSVACDDTAVADARNAERLLITVDRGPQVLAAGEACSDSEDVFVADLTRA